MPANIRDTIIKIVLFSFVVGLLLSFFDINPAQLLRNFGATAEKIFKIVADVIEWGVKYVLLGAVVVVPIWLIFFGIGKLRGK
jgi:Na+/H+-dicarboxylate symporter